MENTTQRTNRYPTTGNGNAGRSRDKFVLYQESVQDPPSEVNFIRRVYRAIRQKAPRILREDFCGTAVLACEWVRHVPDGFAMGVDLDLPTLRYAETRSVAALGPKADRVSLIHGDVLDASSNGTGKPDVVAAFNFSYCIFKSRDVLKRYFRRVRESLAADGVFFLDLYGGPEAQHIQEDRTRHKGFTYVWDQAAYNPITGETRCHIHFEFPDGTKMRQAFTYDWRLWSLPEVRDLLTEVGFRQVDVYWEGTDGKTGKGTGVFRRSVKGDDSRAWVAYIVAAL